ncbi:hypothetical protein F2Q68_00014200 [Brassica cretica]|uniref:Uncharacterized protein n=1 Tax=Brassica cretica TaxID=69181 RepID=A0A8S9HGS2_BRACR|nr:hypothetical protein F2Q68_00014200 [Brassica cretica]
MIFWSPRDHVDSFLRRWGGELGDSGSVSASFIRRAFSIPIRFWGRRLFFFFFGILDGLFVFALTTKCRSAFLSRMIFPVVECAVFARVLVRRSLFRASGSPSRSRASDRPSLISIRDSEYEGASLEERSPISLSPCLEDETVAAIRRRRRSSKATLPGPSRPSLVPEGDGSLFVAQGDLISLAGRMRSAGCRLSSLASSAEKEAYTKVAVVSSKVMEAFNEYVVVMEDRVEASRNDKEIESIGSEIKRLSEELEATKREGKNDAEKIEPLTDDWRRIQQENEALTTQRYREVLESLKEKWTSKKKEVSAEILLQEVIANIDLLNELKDGVLTVDAELARLKEVEGDCEGLVSSAAMSDWSISELDLPQVSKDLVDQVGGSSVPDGSDSS